MIDVLVLIMLNIVALSVGRRLFRIFHVDFTSFGQEIVFSLGLGLGVLAHITFLIGILGGLYSWIFYLILFLALIVLHRDVIELFREIFFKIKSTSHKKYSKLAILLCGVLLITILMNLIAAFAPPSEADTMAYHFAVPKLFIKKHEIFYIPNLTANMPMNQHMLYLLGMLLKSDVLTALIIFVEGIFFVLAIILFCRRYLSVKTGILAATILYTVPLITNIASSGSVEIGLTLFTFLGFWAFFEWTQSRDIKWLIIAAVFVGFAIGTKYYGPISLISFGAIIIFDLSLSRELRFKQALMSLAIFGAVAVIVGAPWYIRNLVNIGNPFHPAFYGIFGGRDWSAELNHYFKLIIQNEKRPLGDSFLKFILVPWDFTINGEKYNAGRIGYGPVFLAFCPAIPLLFLRKGSRRLYGYILLFSLVFSAVWFWMAFQRARHLLPIMPGISIVISGVIIHCLGHGVKLLKYATVTFIGVALLLNLGINIVFNSQFVPVVLGIQAKDEYLTSQLWNYKDVLWINANLSKEDRLLLRNRTICYYLEIEYFNDSYQGRIDWINIKSVDELVKILHDMKITHLFLDEENLTGSGLLGKLRNNGYLKEIYRDDRVVPQYRTLNRGKKNIRSRIYKLNTL